MEKMPVILMLSSLPCFPVLLSLHLVASFICFYVRAVSTSPVQSQQFTLPVGQLVGPFPPDMDNATVYSKYSG